jgi:predicted acetyltransferase
MDMSDGINLKPGWVPMTTHWLLDDAGEVVGVGRLRHRLTPALLEDGGHIGYYVRPTHRGKGYGTEILRLLLVEARKLGIDRALLTVHSDNGASIRVIERNGGVLEDERTDPEGVPYRRYWIALRS